MEKAFDTFALNPPITLLLIAIGAMVYSNFAADKSRIIAAFVATVLVTFTFVTVCATRFFWPDAFTLSYDISFLLFTLGATIAAIIVTLAARNPSNSVKGRYRVEGSATFYVATCAALIMMIPSDGGSL